MWIKFALKIKLKAILTNSAYAGLKTDSFGYLWIIIAVILRVSAIGFYLEVKLMVGLINIGLLDVFNPEESGQKIRFAQPIPEVVHQDRFAPSAYPLPFSVTIGKTEEIQAEAQKIRDIWQEGYNYHTRQIKKIEPLLTGILQLNDFINNYWNYFTSDEKIRLITQASYLKQMSNFNDYFNSNNCIEIIFSRSFLTTIKLFYKYRNNIYENPRNHIFIQFNNANKMVAELIIELAKKDFELANVRQANLARVNARWEEQGESLIDSLDNEIEIEKTPEDLEWEKHLAISHEYIHRQATLFDALPKEYLMPYKGQYVFFEEGEIKDYDNNREDLIDRVYDTVGYRALYIKKVRLEN